MTQLRTIADVLSPLSPGKSKRLPAPTYSPWSGCLDRCKVGCAVESMRNHITDEGWQLFKGLEAGGYTLTGKGITYKLGERVHKDLTDVEEVLERFNPSTVVIQDKREWEGLTADRVRDPKMRFTNLWALKNRPDVFSLTVLKDAHQNPAYHRESAAEMGCHAWVAYYNERVMAHLASFLRPEHCVRTWHTVDREAIPRWRGREERNGCLLSGALNPTVYPLRGRLVEDRTSLPFTRYDPHPGYGKRGCLTPAYLERLSRFRVAVCTSSIYGYCLRKIIEATAVGCKVITDLPVDEVVPEVDANLVRIPSSISSQEVGLLIRKLNEEWDEETQREFARRTAERYNYQSEGRRLAEAIETMRKTYSVG